MKTLALLMCILLLAFLMWVRVEVPTRIGQFRDYDAMIDRMSQ